MTIQIAICDDLSDCLESLKLYTRRYLEEKVPELSYELDVFSHPDELLKSCEKKKYHLFLLDIIMPMVDGIRAAKEIQAENPAAFFIFCTSSRDYPIDAYTVNAIHYLTKPIGYTDFTTAMDRFMIRQGSEARKHIRIPDSAGTVWECPLKALLYIDVEGNGCRVHLAGENSRTVRISLKKLSEELGAYPMLYRMGASYIISLEAVRKIDGNAVVLKNGEKLFIPRGAAADIRKKFIEYYS